MAMLLATQDVKSKLKMSLYIFIHATKNSIRLNISEPLSV